MSNEPVITLIGNLTSDPELRFISSGSAVVNFTIAHTKRVWDKDAGKMADGETLFVRCDAWRQEAENIAESCRKGMRVIAQVELYLDSYEHQGQKKSEVRGRLLELGVSTKFNPVGSSGTQERTSSPQGGSSQDPWAAAPVRDEPPF